MTHTHNWMPARTVFGDSSRCFECGVCVMNPAAYEATEAKARVVLARAERVHKMYEGMDKVLVVRRYHGGL